MRWDDLNMGDKSRMIQLAVNSGITDLRTIRDVFNSYAEGGNIGEDNEEPKPNASVYTKPKGASTLKDMAYRIGTYEPIQQEGAATPINIVKALLRKDVPMDDNKYAYIYGTGDRYQELEEEPRGFDYSNYLNRYGYKGVKNVYGTINPTKEYHIDKSLKPLAEELARNNYHFYDDADDMFLDYDPDVLGYRDDVANFIHQFALDKNGNVVVHDSDVYDFNPVDYQYSRGVSKPLVKMEAKMMDKIGTPYIIRQENQPLKFDGSRRGSGGIEDHLMSMSDEDVAKATGATLLDTVFVTAKHPNPDYDPYDFATGGHKFGPGGRTLSAEDTATLNELTQKVSNYTWNKKQAAKQLRLQRAAKGTKLIIDAMRLFPKTALASDFIDLFTGNPTPDSFEETADRTATAMGTAGRSLKSLYGIPFDAAFGGTEATKAFGTAGKILAIPDLIMDTRTLIKDLKTPANQYEDGGPRQVKYDKPVSYYVQARPEAYPTINKIRPEYLDKYFTIDDTGAIKDNSNRVKYEDRKRQVRDTTGSINYNQDNEIMLTTDAANARYRTGRISTDLLDYIYDNAARAGIPFKEAIGLAGKESTLGIGRGYKRGASISPIDLYSFWYGVGDGVKTNKQMEKLNSTYVKMYNGEQIDQKELEAAEAEYLKLYNNLHDYKGTNLVKDAYDYYKSGKYNSGEKGYDANVILQGEAILQDKAVQKWLQGKKPYKGRGF